MTLRPLGDMVVVRRLAPAEKIGSIFLPDVAKEPPQSGVVVAAGPGARDENFVRIPMDVGEGDHVLFGKYSGTDVVVDGEELLLVREIELLGKVRR
jgi:chaperonin GroES